MAKIYHAHLYGLREHKYQVLADNTINTTNFQEINPQFEFYLLIPQDDDLFSEYKQYFKITDIMPVNGWGIATRKDYFLVDFKHELLIEKFKDICSIESKKAIEKYGIKQSQHWDFTQAIKEIDKDKITDSVKPILFRPFDIRFVFYEKCMIERGDHRYGLMSNMFLKNLSLITVRRSEIADFPKHFYCTNRISVLHSTSAKEGNFVFPLYLYPDTDKPQKLQQEKRPNFSPDFLKIIETKLDYLPTPEAIFYYIYAIFHSPTYRTRYAEFLKIDFPRVPLTSDNQLFTQLSKYGEQLVKLHLMESPLLDNFITQFSEHGGNSEVTAGHPKYKDGNVYINKKDYFSVVPEDIWNFYVGGYQVCQKWLKDRKERTLTKEDINHYQRIVVALQETIGLMSLIDEAIPSFPIE